jgi:hypothetical protein
MCVVECVARLTSSAPGDVPPAGVAPGSERLDFGAEPNVLLVDPSESDSLLIQRLVRFAYRRLRELGLPPQRFDGGLEFTHTVPCKCRVVAGVECLVDGGRFLPASLPGSVRTHKVCVRTTLPWTAALADNGHGADGNET